MDDERKRLLRGSKLKIEVLDKKKNEYILRPKEGEGLKIEFGEVFPLILSYPSQFLEATISLIEKYLDNYEFDKALDEIFKFIDFCNGYTQEIRVWEHTEADRKILYQLIESIRKINPYLGIFIPETAKKIERIFKTDKIKKSEVLFKKI